MRRESSRVEREGRRWSLESGGEMTRLVGVVKEAPVRGRVVVLREAMGRMHDVRKEGMDLVR